jgi:hypothetical protein
MDNTSKNSDNDDLYFDNNTDRAINTINGLKKQFGFDVKYINNYDKLDNVNKSKLKLSDKKGFTYYILKKVSSDEKKSEYYVVLITKIYFYDPTKYLNELSYKILYKIDKTISKMIESLNHGDNLLTFDPFKPEIENIKNIEFYEFETIPHDFPKTIEELNDIGIELGCLPRDCIVMGGKKSKRKRTRTFIRKSMRKSKSKKQKNKKNKKS